MPRTALLVAILALVACGGGGDHLPADAGLAASTYIALDLASGTVTAVADPGPATLAEARWRDQAMLFRRVRAGSYAMSGSALGQAQLAGDAPAASACGDCWVGVFEVTRAQWRRLAGAIPAAVDPPPAPFAAADVSDQPVTGISPATARLVLAGVATSHFRLGLPSTGAWIAACSGGNGRLFAWGDGSDGLVSETYAVCRRSDDSSPGLQAVGTLLAAGGFYDMHGNVWEIVDDGGDAGCSIRGGAWDEPVLQCRTSNRVAIPVDLAHPTVGLRLVLTP